MGTSTFIHGDTTGTKKIEKFTLPVIGLDMADAECATWTFTNDSRIHAGDFVVARLITGTKVITQWSGTPGTSTTIVLINNTGGQLAGTFTCEFLVFHF